MLGDDVDTLDVPNADQQYCRISKRSDQFENRACNGVMVETAAQADPKVWEAQKRVDQAKARLQRAKARSSARARKLDARQKIILGGALLERARRGDDMDSEAVAKLVCDILSGLSRQNDLKAFEGFEL